MLNTKTGNFKGKCTWSNRVLYIELKGIRLVTSSPFSIRIFKFSNKIYFSTIAFDMRWPRRPYLIKVDYKRSEQCCLSQNRSYHILRQDTKFKLVLHIQNTWIAVSKSTSYVKRNSLKSSKVRVLSTQLRVNCSRCKKWLHCLGLSSGQIWCYFVLNIHIHMKNVHFADSWLQREKTLSE